MPELAAFWMAGVRAADPARFDAAFAGEYAALKQAARDQLRRFGGDFGTTALVNETWLKLRAARNFDANDRRHFIALSACAMRQVLVDYVRCAHADKRGAGQRAVTLTLSLAEGDNRPLDALELDNLIDTLARADQRAAEVVTLHCFGGYNLAEIGEVLGVNERTVQRDWRKARAFLLSQLAA